MTVDKVKHLRVPYAPAPSGYIDAPVMIDVDEFRSRRGVAVSQHANALVHQGRYVHALPGGKIVYGNVAV